MSEISEKVSDFNMRWSLMGPSAMCDSCNAVQLVDRAGAPMRHKPGCPNPDAHPWQTLARLLAPLAGTVPAPTRAERDEAVLIALRDLGPQRIEAISAAVNESCGVVSGRLLDMQEAGKVEKDMHGCWTLAGGGR